MKAKQILVLLFAPLTAVALSNELLGGDDLQGPFSKVVRPFLVEHCLDCHSGEEPEAELELSGFRSTSDVVKGFATWQHVTERLKAGEMPPEDAGSQPTAEARQDVIQWSKALRDREAQRNAGDPGPVLARRLNAAEYNYTIRDLTGVDIRPASQFPVDPANEAGFDNTGESLAMTPGLLAKFLDAARAVSGHLVLEPDGLDFASHPVVVETDRDKYCVRRIIDFYARQNTEYADFFFAAWRLRQRYGLNDPGVALADVAAQEGVSPKYLSKVWSLLAGREHYFGPIAKLRSMWFSLPDAEAELKQVRAGCSAMSEFVRRLRPQLGHTFPHVTHKGINNGTQPFILRRNRQYATHRMTLNPDTLHVASDDPDGKLAEAEKKRRAKIKREIEKARKALVAKIEAELAELAVQLKRLVDEKTITEYQAQKKREAAAKEMAKELAKHEQEDELKVIDPELFIPVEQSLQNRHIDAFKAFCAIFPDTFFVKSRGREYAGRQGLQLEDEATVRLLNAGFHIQMGYFRDDFPLYELILSEAEQRELDVLWQELDFISDVPQRQHQGYIWYERGESQFINGPEFDFARSENKDITSEENIRRFADTYSAKAEQTGASEMALNALREHFFIINTNIRRVELAKKTAEAEHLRGLEEIAARAYRRPLNDLERSKIGKFYQLLRSRDGLTHEDAVRDGLVRILTSPHFCYSTQPSDADDPIHPLSQHALASRLSYFLWSSIPDEQLLASADRNELQQKSILLSHVGRMLRDERFRGFATEFGSQWLGFTRFEEHKGVNRDRFPAFDDDLRQAMYEEPIRFTVDLIRRDGSLLEFLYADHTFVNATLAKHYGIDAPSSSGEWVRVDGASRFDRGGLLPMSVFLTKNAHSLRTSPVKRGYWVVRQLLGEQIPPPPPEVPELPNDESKLGDLTLRKVLAKHRENSSCAGCHNRFDALGVALEGFGPIGERRTVDLGGRPVQTAALLPDGVERDGLAGLRDYLSQQREAEFIANTCRKLLSYALGRTLIVSDVVLLDQMRDRLENDDYRFVGLIETIVTSPTFLNQRGRNYRYQE